MDYYIIDDSTVGIRFENYTYSKKKDYVLAVRHTVKKVVITTDYVS